MKSHILKIYLCLFREKNCIHIMRKLILYINLFQMSILAIIGDDYPTSKKRQDPVGSWLSMGTTT